MNIRANGQDCFVYTGGHPWKAGQPGIVFVHGAGMDHTVWLLQSRYLAHHGCNVMAVDLPGHGQTAGPALQRIEAMGEWLDLLLEAVAWTDVQIVGHSMGGLVALDAARRRNTPFKRMVLVGTVCPMPVAQPLLEAAMANKPAAIDMIVGWGHGPRARFGPNAVPGMWMRGSAARLLERAAAGVLGRDLVACNTYTDGIEAAHAARCPISIMVGREDRMTPRRAAAALVAKIPDATLMMLEQCGHMPMHEQPDAFLDALRHTLL